MPISVGNNEYRYLKNLPPNNRFIRTHQNRQSQSCGQTEEERVCSRVDAFRF